MKRIFTLGAALLMLGGMSVLPTLAQDKTGGKMSDGKMSGDKMGGKMSDGKMSGGKMGGKMSGGELSGAALMSKATGGLSDAQKQYVMMKMSKMSATDKMAMEKKLAGYSTTVRKGQVTKMMNQDKMGGKMSDGKMSGDKMGGKMSGDKMGGGGKM